ncbi:Beta-lactamase-like protein 2 [Linderina macrospora]|uniref:Beta-lactamase-like protein 2 n=1 Tax=Linderina macrospora TaxID=4868 RepID=A0ACC1JF80_9FUNG|nr:Beta-lactamase-like protein 2 [Linderina macrospora]
MDKLATVEQISKSILRVLALNPGPFTLQGTNTYVVGNGPRRTLIDTGDGAKPEYLALLRQSLGSSRIDQILLTHWHLDHIGGLSKMLSDSSLTTSDCRTFKNRSPTVDGQQSVTEALAVAVGNNRLFDIRDAQEFCLDGVKIKAVFTPGHTEDHMAFTVDEGGGPMLVTGDLILGQGTTIVHDLAPYMDSLQRVLGIRPSALLPGHGPVIRGTGDAVKVIEGYISHRNLRERQILAVLDRRTAGSRRAWSVAEITTEVYSDITDPNIILAAQNNVTLHLQKLLAEDRVVRVGVDDSLWALRGTAASI